MRMSKFLSAFLVLVLLLSTFAVTYASTDITVLLNGEELEFDVPPRIMDNRTMVPMRAIFEELGATVDWEDYTRTVTATKYDIVIIMQIDNVVISVSGYYITLDVPPRIVENRTLVPVRAVAESLNADVYWEYETRTVIITSAITPETRPARDPFLGMLYGYGNDRIAEMRHEARYMFEQRMLPIIVYDVELLVIIMLAASHEDIMNGFILDIWTSAAAGVIIEDAAFSGEDINFDNMAELQAIVNERRPLFGLGDEHIVSVTIEQIDNNTSVAIIELLDTGWAMLSTYIGIAYSNTYGLHIFTLERSIDLLGTGDVPYMFCFVDIDSRGSFFPIENDRDAFIDAIRYIMGS